MFKSAVSGKAGNNAEGGIGGNILGQVHDCTGDATNEGAGCNTKNEPASE